jgi:hypothetical protein
MAAERAKRPSAVYEVPSKVAFAAVCGEMRRRFQEKHSLLLKRFDYTTRKEGYNRCK